MDVHEHVEHSTPRGVEWQQSISQRLFAQKYMLHGEQQESDVFDGIVQEIFADESATHKCALSDALYSGRLLPAGRILANARPYSKNKYYNNCYTIDVEDSIDAIFSTLRDDALINKTGGGVGFDLSKLRPKNASISAGGTSSGVVSFLKVFNASAGVIHSGGGRRAAHIALLDISHPDVEEFITCKRGDDAFSQFNISVRITDAFIAAVDAGADWDLTFDGKVYKTVKARELYALLTRNAYMHNEPGIFNVDIVRRGNNAPYAFDMDRCNPCLTGDTMVAVADGRNAVDIATLAKQSDGKISFPVYSAEYIYPNAVNSRNKRTPRKKSAYRKVIKNAVAYSTGYKEIIEVKLSDGSSFRCTPDHLLSTSEGLWIPAIESTGIQLEKFYTFSNMDYYVYVSEIVRTGAIEEVFDLTVEDTHNFYIITSTGDSDYVNCAGILVHNCGEITMPAYSLCCLSALNVSKYITNPFSECAQFDEDAFRRDVALGVRFLDCVLDATRYPLQRIEEFSKAWRRIGLGITGLADAFAMLGMRYGSEQSKVFAGDVAYLLASSSYAASAALAEEKGAFPAYDERVLESAFIQRLAENPTFPMEYIRAHGLRNVGLNTVAPTGTTSLTLGQNCSSGIEPIFSTQYTRTYITDALTNEKQTEIVYNAAYLQYMQMQTPAFSEAEIFATVGDIDPYDEIDIQSAMQMWIDHSISKTLNLPATCTYEQYEHLFRYGYRKGLKGMTTFFAGGSMQGVLQKGAHVERRQAPKRPQSLDCDIYRITADKEKLVVFVGKLNGTLYEVFVATASTDIVGTKGRIVKRGKRYDLEMDGVALRDIGNTLGVAAYRTLARFISMSLRHGVPLQFVVEQLTKDGNFVSCEKAIARVLKKYIKDGERVQSSAMCPECGASLVYRDGCKSCSACSWSKCE